MSSSISGFHPNAKLARRVGELISPNQSGCNAFQHSGSAVKALCRNIPSTELLSPLRISGRSSFDDCLNVSPTLETINRVGGAHSTNILGQCLIQNVILSQCCSVNILKTSFQ